MSTDNDLSGLTMQELSIIPVRMPPNGVKSNFGDAPNNNKPMFAVTSPFLVIMALFFLNRMYTKSCIVRKYSWDDCKCLYYG